MSGQWRRNFSMARLSSWKTGGAAKWLFSPAAAADLADLGAFTDRGTEAVLFAGFGSNLLVRDGGYDGVVVHTIGLKTVDIGEERTYVEAGVGCPKLARLCAEQGRLAAFLAGIPGTVGGALAMNAGCHGAETWDFVRSVTVFAGGHIETRPREAFTVSYRQVEKAEDCAFVGAEFTFPRVDAPAAREKIKMLLEHRRQTQPLASATAGSVFCNPPDDHAGRLIEACGLKKLRVGDAEVSDKHANFIVNRGKATAADIETLIAQVRARVAEQTGVTLRPEVRLVGKAAA